MSVAKILDIVQRIDHRIDEPGGQLQSALHDILRIYGLTAQMAEVATQQRDQIQALVEVITMLHGRQIEHNRTAITMTADVHTLLILTEAMAEAQGADIAQLAAAARVAILTAQTDQLALLAAHEEAARAILQIARLDARVQVQQAVDEGQHLLAHDAETARGVVADAESAASNVIADAAIDARDQIQHEREGEL